MTEEYIITTENECTLVRRGDFVCFANDTATLVDLLNLQDKRITHQKWVIEKEKGYVDALEKQSKNYKGKLEQVLELLTEADLFSDNATEHDISAYVDMLEFDNKDAYLIACNMKKCIEILKGVIDDE